LELGTGNEAFMAQDIERLIREVTVFHDQSPRASVNCFNTGCTAAEKIRTQETGFLMENLLSIPANRAPEPILNCEQNIISKSIMRQPGDRIASQPNQEEKSEGGPKEFSSLEFWMEGNDLFCLFLFLFSFSFPKTQNSWILHNFYYNFVLYII
jgi:hypothetical protein